MNTKILLLLPLLISLCSAASIVRRQASGGYGTSMITNDDYQRRSGVISVGTPAKVYRVEFSLTSPDFWLISPNVTFRNDVVSPKVPYNSADSSTSEPEIGTYEAKDATSVVRGQIVRDNVTFAGVSIPNKVQFGVANSGIPSSYDLTSCYFGNCNFDVDGQFGLSPQNGQTALQQIGHGLAQPIVTIHPKKLFQDDGTITVGAVDSENCNAEDYKFAPLLEPKNKWATKIVGVKVGNKTLNITASKLEVVDSKEYMFMPAADLKAVGEAMGAVPYQERDTHYYIDPKEKADITIIIGDDEMGITSEIVIKDPVYFRTSRLFNILGTDLDGGENPDTWYFTAPYLASQCTAVNFKDGTIAFAPIKDMSQYNLSG